MKNKDFEIISALTCDQIITSKEGGKHTLVGVFSSIHSDNFPVFFPSFSFFVTFVNKQISKKYSFKFKVKILDPEGKVVAEVSEQEANFEKGIDVIYSISNLMGVEFGKKGRYFLDVVSGNESLISVPLLVEGK